MRLKRPNRGKSNKSPTIIHFDGRFSYPLLEKTILIGEKKLASMPIYTTAPVLLHLPLPDMPTLDEIMPLLPPGLRFFSCYIMAHKAYLDGDYTHSLGIAKTALSLSEQTYPIPNIYKYYHMKAAIKVYATLNWRQKKYFCPLKVMLQKFDFCGKIVL